MHISCLWGDATVSGIPQQYHTTRPVAGLYKMMNVGCGWALDSLFSNRRKITRSNSTSHTSSSKWYGGHKDLSKATRGIPLDTLLLHDRAWFGPYLRVLQLLSF